MEISKGKVLIAMARNCISTSELAEKANVSLSTLKKVMLSGKCTPKTVGLIAKGLEVDVTEILLEKEVD